MKKHIIISVMLVTALAINAQTTDRGSRTAPTAPNAENNKEVERKAGTVNTESRTREVAPASSNNSSEASQVRTTNPPQARETSPTRTSGAENTRQTSPARTSGSDNTRQTSPARTTSVSRDNEPESNVERSRQTTPVRTTTVTRTVETTATPSRSSGSTSGRNVSGAPPVNQERPARVYEDEPSRKTGTNVNSTREPASRSAGEVRPQTDRNTGSSRVDANERNREYVPRTDHVTIEKRQAYRTPERPRTERTVSKSVTYNYQPLEYRRTYYPYATPRKVEIIWNTNMYHEYRYLYPQYDYWYYPIGYRIHTVSAYDAYRYIGELARVYGRITEVWYERQTDEYYLYIGGPYSYQDLTLILPGKIARRYSYRPDRYFTNRNIAVTGLVSVWDKRPEILIKKRSQIEIYL